MLASTSARLLTGSTSQRARLFCSCAPVLAKRTADSAVPSYVPKPGRKNAAKNPRPSLSPKMYPDTELFQALKGEGITAINHRPTLVNEDSCRDLVRAWGVDKMHDVTVIEPYAGEQLAVDGQQGGVDADGAECGAGPGGLTRALLELSNVKRVIAVEEAVRYTPYLKVSKGVSLRTPGRPS